MDISKEIDDFISTHESIISKEERDKGNEVRFTRFGNRVSRRVLSEIMSILDEENKINVIYMMKNKKYENY